MKPRKLSKITNGNALLPGVDGRNRWIRRCKDLIEAHTGDIGGAEHASQAELSIIRRCAVLSVELETLEAQFAIAGAATTEQLGLYATVSNGLRRMLESLGLERRARDITPTLSSYLATKAKPEPVGVE